MLTGEQRAQPAPSMRDGSALAPGYEELGQGLMLLRASAMKMVRLQLAMERRDRRAAMETLDELVVLDGRIRDLLTVDDHPMCRQLEEERSALVRERLLLAAGTSGPRLTPDQPAWIEPAAPAPPEPQEVTTESSAWGAMGEEEALLRRSSALPILVTLMVLAFIAAGGAVLVGTTGGQELLAPLLSSIGISR